MHRGAFAASLAVALFAGTGAAPAATPPCSSDAFSIDGSSVAVVVCVTVAAPAAAHRDSSVKPPPAFLEETLTVKGEPPLVRSLALDAAPTDDASRSIDDVPLAKLGLARTLHLTIVVRNAGVRLEHVLLVPGAVTLK
jgi:hypothetical protein